MNLPAAGEKRTETQLEKLSVLGSGSTQSVMFLCHTTGFCFDLSCRQTGSGGRNPGSEIQGAAAQQTERWGGATTFLVWTSKSRAASQN